MPARKRSAPAPARALALLVGALALISVALATAAGAVPRSGPSAAPAASVFLSPSGSDTAACTAAAPCRSLDRGYHVAKPGEIVQLAGGDYGSQSLSYDASKLNAGKHVVFRPAPGETAAVSGELSVRTAASQPVSWVEFDNISFGDYYVAYAQHVIFRDDRAAYFFLRSVSDVKILGGQIGPNQGDGTSPTVGGYAGTAPSENVTIDGVDFSGLTRSHTGEHAECLFVQESDHLIVRNSRFSNCDTISVYLSTVTGGQITNALIENNFIAAPTDHAQPPPYDCAGCVDLSISAWETPNLIVRYNSLSGSTRFAAYNGQIAPGIQAIANVGYQTYCTAGISYARNVWSGITCGETDVKAPQGFVDPANLDFHLLRGAAALGRGDPSSAPRLDIDGQPRPRRMAADAGADQREPASIVIGKSIGAVTLGMQKQDVLDFLGNPRRVAKRRGVASGVRVAFYRAHGGQLWVVYDNDVVVGVGTTSPYYETAKGVGPGVPTIPGIRRLRWDPCQRSYWSSSNGIDTYYVLSGGSKDGHTISSIAVQKHGYYAAASC
ncbi:MAG: hypothetical protein ACXVZP_03650 [Gaiellaceae bacterium]